jgi:hypothetical protein
MCDFRQPPKTVLNKETGEVFDVKYHGFIGVNFSRAVDPGIYMIGATGAGYSYFDGEKWQGGYSYDNDKYEMLFNSGEHGSPHIDFL